MRNKSVKLIECFNSYQGEGPDSGRSMLILRFKKCNLNCKWCDTKVKMRIGVEARYSLRKIQSEIDRTKCGILITGGEPTFSTNLEGTVLLLNELSYSIANVETNGYKLYELISQCDPEKNIHFMYSPKIFNSEDLENVKYTTEELAKSFAKDWFIKIVYEDRKEIIAYLDWLEKEDFDGVLDQSKIWLMPEGSTKKALIANSGAVFDACEKYGFNFSSRDHIIFGFI